MFQSVESIGFHQSISKDPSKRNEKDVLIIYKAVSTFLKSCSPSTFQLLQEENEETLIQQCARVRLLQKDANEILYCRGELANTWYLLLTGSVFINGSMFLPIVCFGNDILKGDSSTSTSSTQSRRMNECLILETSVLLEFPYIPYAGIITSLSSSSSVSSSSLSSMSSYTCNNLPDLSGLTESVVDDSEEDEEDDDDDDFYRRHRNDFEYEYDDDEDEDDEEEEEDDVDDEEEDNLIRAALEKDPKERNEDDIQMLFEYTKHFEALAILSPSIRSLLCQKMVYAVVPIKNTTVLQDNEELDSWSVILHGTVQIIPSSTQASNPAPVYLTTGQSFGCKSPPSLEKQYFKGTMVTVTKDCQFICVTQQDYYEISKQFEQELNYVYDKAGSIVLVTRTGTSSTDGMGSKKNEIVKGTIEKLKEELIIKDQNEDATYIEDFLLTHRLFMKSIDLANFLLDNYMSYPDKITRIFSLWVNNHINDFDNSIAMRNVIWSLTEKLTSSSASTHRMMFSHHSQSQQQQIASQQQQTQNLRLLQMACSVKSRIRTATITRKSRDSKLNFDVMGGFDNGYNIFIRHVENDSMDLRKGDEILCINKICVKNFSLAKVMEIINNSTHLVMDVKWNLLGYWECLCSRAPINSNDVRPVSGTGAHFQEQPTAQQQTPQSHPQQEQSSNLNLTKLYKLVRKWKSSKLHQNHSAHSSVNANSGGRQNLKQSVMSQPSPYQQHSQAQTSTFSNNLLPKMILKIYHTDSNFKYIPITTNETVKQILDQCIIDFKLNTTQAHKLILVLYHKESNSIKQTRLHDNMNNIIEKLELGSRLYVKEIHEQIHISDDLNTELNKQLDYCFLDLNHKEISKYLTEKDYTIFKNIHSNEFIEDLIVKSPSSTSLNLKKFCDITDLERFWAVNLILFNGSLKFSYSVDGSNNFHSSSTNNNFIKKKLILRKLIDVAIVLLELRNFNTAFAITSAIGHLSIMRFKKNLWNRLGKKYKKKFDCLESLMDPSKNMGRYRNLLGKSTPAIPFYPIIKKDLTFIHLGNQTFFNEHLVNWEKMKSLSREIRSVMQYGESKSFMNQNNSSKKFNPSAQILVPTGGGAATTLTSNSSTHNFKKLWNIHLQRLRVKNYIETTLPQTINDEKILDNISMSISNSSLNTTGTSSSSSSKPSSSLLPRKSPSLSTVSSTASTNSSDSYLKLNNRILSLAEEHRLLGNKKNNNSCHNNGNNNGNNGSNNPNSNQNNNNNNSVLILTNESSSVCSAKFM